MNPAMQAMFDRNEAKAMAHFREVATLETTGPRHTDERKSWWRRLIKTVTESQLVVDRLNEQVAILKEQEAELAILTRLRDEQAERVKRLQLAASLCVDLETTKRMLSEMADHE